MKSKAFGTGIVSLIIVITFVVLSIIAFFGGTDSKPTTQAAISCEHCEGACAVSHKAACKTAHNAPNYYYYTYKCTECGKEFSVEKTEKNFKNF